MNVYKLNYKHIFIACGVFLILALCSVMYMGRNLSHLEPTRRGKRLLARDRFMFSGSGNRGGESIYTKGRRDVPIVVVEEHHEVLHHWFNGVTDGVVHRHGNFLIHIDGHSDGAPPVMLGEYPESLYPKTRPELTAMIQRNDAFIVAAALSGFITRSVWIWPAWDAQNHEQPFEAALMLLGVVDTVYHEMDDVHIKSACMCEPDHNERPINCTFMNVTDDDAERGSSLDPRLCDIKTKMYQFNIREDVALEMARNGSLFRLAEMDEADKGRVLLDIDEDFYGCESAVQPALDEKLDMKTIKRISLYVNWLFAPLNAVMESAVDRFLGKFIRSLVHAKRCSANKVDCHVDANALAKYEREIIEGTALRGALRSRNTKRRQKFWKTLHKLLEDLTVPQLLQLKELGFCFQTTPKAFDFSPGEEEHVRVCHGANTPNMSVVNYHTPTEDENSIRTQLLQSLLSATRKSSVQPSMVTVCRSMRDGYTPRKYFHDIEKDVLTTVQDVFDSRAVHYDVDLMGGERGWPGRHDR